MAARHGVEIEHGLERAAETYVDVDIHKSENAKRLEKLDTLPANCKESAEALSRHREVYEQRGVFSPRIIDGIISRLKDFDDEGLTAKATADAELMQELVNRYFHAG